MSQIGSIAGICVCEDFFWYIIRIGITDIGLRTVVFIQCLRGHSPVGKKLPGISKLLKGIGQSSFESSVFWWSGIHIIQKTVISFRCTGNFKAWSEHICHIGVNYISIFAGNVFQRFLWLNSFVCIFSFQRRKNPFCPVIVGNSFGFQSTWSGV